MFPSNSYMDPYFSRNKEQIPYPPYPFYPYPVPVRSDPSTQPASFAPWPHNFNPTPSNGYAYPVGYYGPRPPLPYELSPPNFPNYYHPYFSPMPIYPANHPQIDHSKSEIHCCGCPNHVCHGKDSPKVKIYEKPELDQRKVSNNTYPYFWFSPRNDIGQDQIEKPKEKQEAQFPWPIVWMPEDEVKEKEKEKKEMNDAQFPWPIIWMPEDDKKETKDQGLNKRVSEETPKPTFRIIPLKFLEHGDKNQDEMKKIPVTDEKKGDEEAVKGRSQHGDKDHREVKKVSIMEKKDGGEKGREGQILKERGSTGEEVADKRHSKLPPVCLRVDPLPHKKPTNGSSKEYKNKKEVKVIDVKSAKEELQERKDHDVKSNSKPEENKTKKEINVVDVKSAEGKELNARDIQADKDVKEKLDEIKVDSVKRARMSEQDAALLMQSVYRGYNVRRWDPLEKLKKIRGVREKAQELLGKLQHVEEAATHLEKKEQLVLSESIMNLLLQLDTIQGLHPTVREARKSVARELISLQEKLDSLVKQKPVEAPTNEVQQSQLEMQPATTDSCEEGKLVSEQVNIKPSDTTNSETMSTQKEDEMAGEILKKVEGSAVVPDLFQSATDLPPVEETTVNNEDAHSLPEQSQVAPVPEETKCADLLPETNASESSLKAEQLSPQTDISQSESVESHATEVIPNVTIENDATELAPAVTATDISSHESNTLSETKMHDTDVTSSVPEEIHATEVASGVVVTDGTNTVPTISETKNPDEYRDVKEVQIHATESHVTEMSPEVTSGETATNEVEKHAIEVTPEESHGKDAGTTVEDIQLQAIEGGNSNNEEGKSVEDIEIAEDVAISALPEVEIHETEDASEESRINDGGASVEKVELESTEVDEFRKEENEVVEENKTTPDVPVTAVLENKNTDGSQEVEKVDMHAVEECPNLTESDATRLPQVTDHATEGGKLSVEEKKLVEENEKLRAMLEKLLEAGRDQLDVITGLNERVKGLEKQLERKSKKHKVWVKKHKPATASSIKV